MPNAPDKKESLSFSMLGWALNEQENIAAYIERGEEFLASLTSNYELIIIDDGSTDRTWEIATKYQDTRPWLRLYQNDRNRGSGYNTKRALSLAQKDYVFWQTVDWSYDITNIGACIGLVQQYDVLQGVRSNIKTLPELFQRRSDNPYKAVISIVNYLLVRLLFQLPLSDFQNVTVYPRGLIQSIQLESESAFTNPECLLKAWWKGATIKEIPTPFMRRRNGQAKGTRPKAILTAIEDVFRWWFRWIILGKRTDKGRGKVIRWNEA